MINDLPIGTYRIEGTLEVTKGKEDTIKTAFAGRVIKGIHKGAKVSLSSDRKSDESSQVVNGQKIRIS